MNFLILSVLLGITVCDEVAPPVDWAKYAAETTWSWPKEESTLFSCTMDMNEPYQIVLEHIWSEKFLVHISRNNKPCLKFEAHGATVFDRCRNKFIYAQFATHSSG